MGGEKKKKDALMARKLNLTHNLLFFNKKEKGTKFEFILLIGNNNMIMI